MVAMKYLDIENKLFIAPLELWNYLYVMIW